MNIVAKKKISLLKSDNVPLPVLIAFLSMTIKDEHRKSSVGFQVLLVQAKLLVRVPEKISIDFCTFAIAFFAFVPNLSHALDHSLVQVWHLLPEIPGKRMIKYLILSRVQIPMIAAILETTFKSM